MQFPRLILVGLLAAAVVVSNGDAAAHHSKSHSKSKSNSGSSSSFTTSGPESTKSTLAAPPTANRTSRLGDLAESQSAQSSSVVHAPKTATSSSSTSISTSSSSSGPSSAKQSGFRRAASSPSTTSTTTSTTSSTTPRDLLTSTSTTSHHQMVRQQSLPTATSGGSTLNMPYAQQQLALMRAKPGQFTLVSNQQLGPGHVTMIGYTTPIVKVGGIVKIDQVAPGTMPRSEGDTIVPPPALSGSASSAIYTSSGSPPMVSHHSQMINHGVVHSQKEGGGAPASPSSNDLLQDSPQERRTSGGSGRGSSSLPRAELSSSPGSSSPYGSPLLGELPPGYSFAPPQGDQQQSAAAFRQSSPFGLSYQSFAPEALVGYGGGQRSSSSKLQQQSSPMGMTFSAPMEKPKPFLVFKPGYEGKMKSSAAPPQTSPYGSGPQVGGPPMMMLVNQPPLVSSAPPPSYQQLFQQQQQQSFQPPPPPMSPISMAHFGGGSSGFGQAKPLEKPQSPYNNILPINDLEGNDLNSGPLVPSQVMPPFESQRTSISGSSGQFGLVNGQANGGGRGPQPQSMSSIAKQMDSFAQQLQQRPSQQSGGQSMMANGGQFRVNPHMQGPLSMMPMPMHHQQMPAQKAPASPQSGPSQFEQSMMQQQQQQNQQMSPKMFGQPMQHQQQQQMNPNPNQQQQLDQNPFLNANSQQLSPQQSPFGSSQSPFEGGRGGPSVSSPNSQFSKFNNFDQGSSSGSFGGAPESQVTSTIRMPESKSKVDPRQELQDQINFVLQNSPNLSAGSRGRHREDIFKAVQESLAESDNSVSRPSIMSSNGGGSSSSYFKQQSPSSSSNSGASSSPFDLGSLTIDGLSQQSPPPPSSSSSSSSSLRPESSAEGNPKIPRDLQSAYYPNGPMGHQYKPSSSAFHSPSSRLIPDPSSSYYSRYNTENVHPFSPMEFTSGPASGAMPIHPGTHSAAQASAALARDYKVKLQQEITRYLSDQMDPATASKQQHQHQPNSEEQQNSGPPTTGNFLFSLSPYQQQSGMNFQPPSMSSFGHPSSSSMLKYASSPLRKVTSNLVDNQRQQQYYQSPQQSSSALLLDSNPGSSSPRSPRDLSASSNSQPQQQPQVIGGHHFVLGRHTEFVQSQASQPARTAVKAPEGATAASEASASVSPSSKSTSSSSSPFSNLMNQLSIEASGPSSDAMGKSLRGYSEWWKESAAAAAARPIVVHQLTSYTQK